jgi:hypothetical protein
MSLAEGTRYRSVFALIVFVGVACGAPEPFAGDGPRDPRDPTRPRDDGSSGSFFVDGGLSSDEGGVPLDGQNPNGGGGPDTDSDGVPDGFDCDPQSSRLGARLVEDDLSSAKGLISAAPGFDSSAWTHQSGGYRQAQVRDSGDLSLFTQPASGNFSVEVTATSLSVGTFAPRLRQDFVVLGASIEQGSFNGLGCGVEVVEGGNPEMKASIVALSGGGAAAIVTNPIKRADRQPIQVNEPFSISVRVENGSVTCTVTQSKGTTTVAAPNIGELRGGVGFFTRQTSAQFSKVRICQIK